ncbi:SAV0927 family protein [Niallia endozanthoxylica]|uniref:DUF3055 family protein n=1 Tax=Niallia endozanthoxylica TaxID=2036016 RepID=A0A5J5HN03_9BACI|nr:SAV0927 family protein [Niallia endozanthoxylica]KAA9022603.1 DUF3055 family protein [Niallia endozanthoxylica]
MALDYLLDETENQMVRYYCIASKDYRYDIVIVHSEMFLGKAMVMSIQNRRMVLLSYDDISDANYWGGQLGIQNTDINKFKDFFYMVLDKGQLLELF